MIIIDDKNGYSAKRIKSGIFLSSAMLFMIRKVQRSLVIELFDHKTCLV